MNLAGRFITLEGGEGVGKSTLMASLAERLASTGSEIVTTREPGGTRAAEQIRALVLTPKGETPLSGLAQALLMNAARADHLDRLIRPALDRGALVLCDRFADSTRVYQTVAGGCPETFLNFLEAEVVGPTRPDLTLILDAAPEDMLQRRAGRTETPDVFEAADLGFHTAIRQGFLAIAEAEPDRCAVLDANQSADAVLTAALAAIEARLGNAA